MKQKVLSELFKDEIDSLLESLSNIPDLPNIISKVLAQYIDDLTTESESTQLWVLLPLIVCEAISKHYEHAVPFAVSQQFFRAAADILDDVEDADSAESLSSKYGSAVAINVATTLILLAEKAITRLKRKGLENRVIVHVIDTVNSFHSISCAGQHLDISLSPEESMSEEVYLKVIGMKSASQVECACHVGALLAGASLELIESFTKFGYNLGMAAQITNDIQGITNNTDITKGKLTLPVIYALTQTDNQVRDQLESIFIRQLPEGPNPTQVKGLLFSTGAIHYSVVKMEYYKQQALDILSYLEKAGTNTERLKLFLK
jgi:geranylgeranyl pyrophosphate synthase